MDTRRRSKRSRLRTASDRRSASAFRPDGTTEVVSKENAFTFVQNEKTIDLALVLAKCLRIMAPTFWIIRMLISRRGPFSGYDGFSRSEKEATRHGKTGSARGTLRTPLFWAERPSSAWQTVIMGVPGAVLPPAGGQS